MRSLPLIWLRLGATFVGALLIEWHNAALGEFPLVAPEPLPCFAYLAGVLCGWAGIGGWAAGQAVYRLAVLPEGVTVSEIEGLVQWLGYPGAYALLGLAGYLSFRLGGRLGRTLPDYRSYTALLIGSFVGSCLTAAMVSGLFGSPLKHFLIAAAGSFVSVLVVAPLALLVADRYLHIFLQKLPNERRLPTEFPHNLEIRPAVRSSVPLPGRLGILSAVILAVTGFVVVLNVNLPEITSWPLLGYVGLIILATEWYGMRGGLCANSVAGISYLMILTYVNRENIPDDRDLYVINLYVPFLLLSLIAVVIGSSRETELQLRRQMSIRDQMSDLLQAAVSAEEAYQIIRGGIDRLLPRSRGTLYVTTQAERLVEVIVWGEDRRATGVFSPHDCWALRRGQSHWVQHDDDPTCTHLEGSPGSYICIPLLAQSETIGVFHLVLTPGDEETESRLAETLARQIALALGNLRLREALRIQTLRDPLTNLSNRLYLEERLDAEVARAARDKGSIAILMADIDHFKNYNDTYGHQAGDAALRGVADFLKSHSRGADIVARYGGEEFTLVYPSMDLEAGARRAEQLRDKIQNLRLQSDGRELPKITLSIGVAAWPGHGGDWQDVLREADQALYKAKRGGRNRVVAAAEPADEDRGAGS